MHRRPTFPVTVPKAHYRPVTNLVIQKRLFSSCQINSHINDRKLSYSRSRRGSCAVGLREEQLP